VIVEGKTDVTHLETAWVKLNPGKPQPWEIAPCGGLLTNRGGVRMQKTMLEACGLHTQRPVLGLFDHDKLGVEQFNGLGPAGFTEATETTHWCHRTQPVHSLLLPVPPGRENFVTAKATSCHLALEHYYSDSLLNRFGMAGDPVVADSAVFDITSDSRKKARFAEALSSLDSSAFAHFRTLFDQISRLLGVQAETAPVPPPQTAQSGPQVVASGESTPQTALGVQSPPVVVNVAAPRNAVPQLPLDVQSPPVVTPNESGPVDTTLQNHTLQTEEETRKEGEQYNKG
jgi:hypothetical protein